VNPEEYPTRAASPGPATAKWGALARSSTFPAASSAFLRALDASSFSKEGARFAGVAGQLVSGGARRHRCLKAEACTTVRKNQGQNKEKILVPELTAPAPTVSDTVDANLKNLSLRHGPVSSRIRSLCGVAAESSSRGRIGQCVVGPDSLTVERREPHFLGPGAFCPLRERLRDQRLLAHVFSWRPRGWRSGQSQRELLFQNQREGPPACSHGTSQASQHHSRRWRAAGLNVSVTAAPPRVSRNMSRSNLT
jgi:hypothetical protein